MVSTRVGVDVKKVLLGALPQELPSPALSVAFGQPLLP